VETAWRRTYRLAALRGSAPESESRKLLPAIGKVAAGLFVLAIIGLAYNLINTGPRQRTYATGLGGHARLTLADGSHIELNTQTVLRAPASGTSRTVRLEKGEAYFEIVHDAAHPFTVVAGDRRIVDLGTKFLVRREGERLEVSLIEGRARVDLEGEGAKPQSIVLLPGDVAIASQDNIVVNKQAIAELDTEAAWRSGLLVFNHTTLEDAAREFNRYNRKQLVIADPAIARSEIFGTFRARNVELFARVAEETFGFHVKESNGSILIER
jgi:transmembrane sensor